jgi:hypothetical protein
VRCRSPDAQSLYEVSFDGEERLLGRAEAEQLLAAEFARRGWDPVVIWVDHERVSLPET